MPYGVLLTAGAESDLANIYDYIAEADGLVRADHILERLLKITELLAEFPERGTHPKELLALGSREYRQIPFKPYRLIYHVVEPNVIISVIADGRRDMQSLLARRLLSAE